MNQQLKHATGAALKPRIVVIDDESAYQQLIQAFAAASFFPSAQFGQWSDGIIEELSTDDLLFLDIHMPGTDGIDIWMKLNDAGFQGGLVIMSGADESVVASTLSLSRSLRLNVVGALEKPFRLASFKHLIAEFSGENDAQNDEEPAPNFSLTDQEIIEGIENQTFYPVFQPQVDLNEGTVKGIECLTRINHPLLGKVSPYIFITQLERLGLIDQYTRLFIKATLTTLQDFLAQYPSVSVSFNIASSSLTQKFTSEILELIEELKIDNQRLTLEITESSAVTLAPEALYAVSKFRAQGINLSIDDFGTGFSTIKLLKDLPFNEVKIDRSFIADIQASQKSLAIVKSMADLSKSLDFNLVVEGVENSKQLSLIKKLNCGVVQGFVFSKPLTLEKLSDIAKNPIKFKFT